MITRHFIGDVGGEHVPDELFAQLLLLFERAFCALFCCYLGDGFLFVEFLACFRVEEEAAALTPFRGDILVSSDHLLNFQCIVAWRISIFRVDILSLNLELRRFEQIAVLNRKRGTLPTAEFLRVSLT